MHDHAHQVQSNGSRLRPLLLFVFPVCAGFFLDTALFIPLCAFSIVALLYEMATSRSNKLVFALYVVQLWWIGSSYLLVPPSISEAVPHAVQGDGKLKTMSVVLPCSGEGVFARKTIQSVFETVPSNVLHEIIVVDDNSYPALEVTFLDTSFRKKHKVTVLRQNSQQGLIRSKLIGGNAATGDIIVFFDCHVAPQPKWYIPFVDGMNENYKRVILPVITALDVDTWTQKNEGGMSKCYLTFDADFKWFDSDNDDAPALSGGLLGISRRWWTETGGYDDQMYGWGGENIDQSYRTWLCGGEMKVAPTSFVAHMWRTNDMKTRANYKHVGSSSRNRLRAIYAWMGPFAEKVKSDFPIGMTGEDPGDMSNIIAIRDRLKCKPFAYYLHRFRSIYIEAALVPEKTFALKAAGGCLMYKGSAGTSGSGHGVVTVDPACKITDRHRFHASNRMMQQYVVQGFKEYNANATLSFSGLRAWNTDQCFNSIKDGEIVTEVCGIDGSHWNQQWRMLENKIMDTHSSKCLSLADGHLAETSCAAASSWEMFETAEPSEWTYFVNAKKERPELFE